MTPTSLGYVQGSIRRSLIQEMVVAGRMVGEGFIHFRKFGISAVYERITLERSSRTTLFLSLFYYGSTSMFIFPFLCPTHWL